MPTLSGFRENKKNTPSSNNVLPRKNASLGTVSNSFAVVLKSGPVNHNTVTESSPAIVLDDACIMERDFSCSLMGKMKDINALSNLFIILANEGFENVKLFYLGGQWVLLELDSVTSKEKITNHVGLPVKALTRNTYAKIIASWGELVDINESDNCSLSCIRVSGSMDARIQNGEENDTSSDEESEGNNENDRGLDNKHVSETSFAHENVDEFQSLGMRMCPLSFSLCLDRASFNHRLIRLHELNVDYDLRLSSFPSGLPGRMLNAAMGSILSMIDESLNLSHLFYADDVIFVAAKSIGCSILHTPFNYLGVKVGGIMSRLSSWDDVIAKLSARLSKWKLKSLSIGGRLTLIKSVLSSLPNFFNGVENAEKKMSLIGWNKILASKKNGGLGVSTIYGIRGALDNSSSYSRRSPWLDIVNEVRKLASKGIDLLSLVKKKVGNGEATSFWNDVWLGDFPLKQTYPRLYFLELDKHVSVASKLRANSLISSFRRSPRSGIEEEQLLLLISNTSSVILPNISDRWSWLLDPSGDFSVKSTREFIDDSMLPKTDVPTRWVKSIPIKINIFAWRVFLDKLPTRGIFLSRPYIPSIIALICRIACGINFAPPFTLAQLASSVNDLRLFIGSRSKKTWYGVPRDVDVASGVYGSSSGKSTSLPKPSTSADLTRLLSEGSRLLHVAYQILVNTDGSMETYSMKLLVRDGGNGGLEGFSRGMIGDSERVISNEGMLWRGSLGKEEVVAGEGVVVTSSSLEMLTNNYPG
ncbi:hypothetical protein Tco_1571322 [Tanacetum coccineum]